jgi:hypothetical protein
LAAAERPEPYQYRVDLGVQLAVRSSQHPMRGKRAVIEVLDIMASLSCVSRLSIPRKQIFKYRGLWFLADAGGAIGDSNSSKW